MEVAGKRGNRAGEYEKGIYEKDVCPCLYLSVYAESVKEI